MKFINFNIIKWFALCPAIAEPKGWDLLAAKQPLCIGVLNESPVNLIPPMMRRRMSSLSKMALQTAIQLLQCADVDYIVFASRHGELTRTVKLIEDVIVGGDASPIMFSQSVHNTAAGLFTIACKQATPICSLAAGENTLHSALIEANGYLQDNPTDTVLLINFDEPLPAPYQKFDEQQHRGFALGLLLKLGNEYKIKCLKHTQENESTTHQAFSCIDYFLKDKTLTSINTQRCRWLWEKN